MRIRFQGEGNVDYGHVSQTAVVEPGVYRFEAQLRTEGLTTDEGVAFRIFDPESRARLDVWTESFTESRDWTRVEKTLRVVPGTRLVEVRVARKPSWKFDNKIQGTAWVDAVSLEKVRQGASRFDSSNRGQAPASSASE